MQRPSPPGSLPGLHFNRPAVLETVSFSSHYLCLNLSPWTIAGLSGSLGLQELPEARGPSRNEGSEWLCVLRSDAVRQ